VTLTFDIQLHCGDRWLFVLELGRPISPANAPRCEISKLAALQILERITEYPFKYRSMSSKAPVSQTQGSVDDDHECNEELWVLIPIDPSTNFIHCIYEVHSKAHSVGAASQSR